MLNFFLNMLNILSKDASQSPASLVKIILTQDGSRCAESLLKMSLFHRCFLHILLVKTNYLVSP